MDKRYQALQDSHKILAKQNTQLHAQLNQLKKDNKEFREEALKKIAGVVKTYDASLEDILNYLCDEMFNRTVTNATIRDIEKLLPMKVGK